MDKQDAIPVIVVFGPTAVGKTDFLLNFSSFAEVISLDSLQVYKHMEIGTAKPNVDIRQKIKHHLIDFLDPNKEFSAGDFVEKADSLCKEIYAHGKIPLVSGGNAFFLINFINGMPLAPKCDPDVRQTVTQKLKTLGIAALADELAKLDPEYLNKIGKNDPLRITRALEVCYSTGKPLSSFKPPNCARKCCNFFIIGLERDRDELYTRINKRVDAMFAAGLADEFVKLKNMGYGKSSPGMSAIGYREFFCLDDNANNLENVKEMIKKNTRRYAKRQITFFKKVNNVFWTNPDAADKVMDKLSFFINSNAKYLIF